MPEIAALALLLVAGVVVLIVMLPNRRNTELLVARKKLEIAQAALIEIAFTPEQAQILARDAFDQIAKVDPEHLDS